MIPLFPINTNSNLYLSVLSVLLGLHRLMQNKSEGIRMLRGSLQKKPLNFRHSGRAAVKCPGNPAF